MKKRYKNSFDKKRRDLLKIITSAGISKGLLNASPLVGGMMISRLAEAQTGPNKSVVIYTPDGCVPEQWLPNSNLTQFKPMSAPYQTVAGDCNFLGSIKHHRAGHGVMPTVLNNRWTGDSFDVNIGRTIGADYPFMYLNLGVHSNGHGYITRDNGTEVPFEDNPFNAFNRLFGNLPGSSGGGSSTGNSGTGSVIDAHKQALDALQRKLGNYEKERLDAHLTAIEETEKRLASLDNGSGGNTGSCNPGAAPSRFSLEYATFDQQAKLQADIVVMALQCNLTASCSLGLGNHQGEFTLPGIDFTGIYHQSIHGGNNGDPSYPHFCQTRAKLSEFSVYLIQGLRDAGILDTTIVCNTTDMGHADAHGSEDIPLVMSGGGSRMQHGKVTSASSYTPLHMLHTAAVALGASQHPNYQQYASSVIPGVLT